MSNFSIENETVSTANSIPADVSRTDRINGDHLGSEVINASLLLVEPLNLELCFQVLQTSNVAALPFYQVVETIFSSLFYTHIWAPHPVDLVDDWLSEPLIYTVTHTPFRKFKAALPWLLSGCNRDILRDCLCAELIFSLFYVIDDLLDQKRLRYGKETAFGKFGANINHSTWKQAHNLNEVAIRFFEGSNERMQLWKASLAEIESEEKFRADATGTINLSQYFDRSKKRTAFLGAWWELASKMAGCRDLMSVFSEIYPLCAVAGQVRNDLRNMSHREKILGGEQFSDFTDGRYTALTIQVLDMAASSDLGWIQRLIWGRGLPVSLTEAIRLEQICLGSGAVEIIKTIINNKVHSAEAIVAQSNLSDEVKAILSGWIFRQFRVGVTSHYNDSCPDAVNFVAAAKSLAMGLS